MPPPLALGSGANFGEYATATSDAAAAAALVGASSVRAFFVGAPVNRREVRADGARYGEHCVSVYRPYDIAHRRRCDR